MTIREKMKKGLLYTDNGEGLNEERIQCKELIYDYNLTRPSEQNKRKSLLKELLGDMGENVWIEPLFIWPTEKMFILAIFLR